ncbi:MAG: hypothetical protein ACR2KV_01545 [Solirubrobacteraceae bacterium]
MANGGPNPMRSFDPRRVGALECRTWVSYYRRDWAGFLRAAVSLTRHVFGLPWPAAVRGAWLVLRANQAWAPYPANDPARARRSMEEFYALIAAHHGEPFDVAEAARLEVEWWRVHREHQRGSTFDDGPAAGQTGEAALVEALAALYSHVYRVPAAGVAGAARERALAMDISDAWVDAGCDPASPLIEAERAGLVRSYAALLAAVHRP